MAELDIRNFTRKKTPKLPFEEAMRAALPGWDISLVFAGRERAQSLNIALRAMDYVPNVLSYEVGTPELARGMHRRSGEIIICPEVARKQAPSYGLSVPNYILFLFIHGLLHLKGLRHGAIMDARERAILARVLSNSFSPSKWHDASQPASISARTRRKSSSSKK